jgi:hypothetical protein
MNQDTGVTSRQRSQTHKSGNVLSVSTMGLSLSKFSPGWTREGLGKCWQAPRAVTVARPGFFEVDDIVGVERDVYPDEDADDELVAGRPQVDRRSSYGSTAPSRRSRLMLGDGLQAVRRERLVLRLAPLVRPPAGDKFRPVGRRDDLRDLHMLEIVLPLHRLVELKLRQFRPFSRGAAAGICVPRSG